MKRLFSLSLLIVILATSCKTSSDLASSALIQKRRYTKGYNLNMKKPVDEKTDRAEEKISDKSSGLLAQANAYPAPTPIETKGAKLKSEKQNEHKLASMELSNSLLSNKTVSYKKGEAYSAAPTSIQEAYPLRLAGKFTSDSKFSNTPTALAASGEVTVLIIILTILLPPLGVALVFGLSAEFWLSLLLTLLFYFPGLVYSLIVIL